MITLAGYFAAGTDVQNNRLIEISGRGYVRPPITWVCHPMTDSVPTLSGIEAPAHGIIRLGAIYNAQTQGRCLAWFRLTPPTREIPYAGLDFWPGLDVTVKLDFRVEMAVSAVRSGRHTDLVISEGNSFAAVNGMPLVAGCRLCLEPDTGRITTTAAAKAGASPRRQHASSG